MESPLEWSFEMDSLFWNHITRQVLDDPRTDWSEDLSLGYPFAVIREQVIGKGLADFGTGHEHEQFGPLTADEKALLYCFVNFKKHFFACLATYELHRADIESAFRADEPPTVVDVGCGPGTACLALCDYLKGQTIRYIGIDSADSMRRRALELLEAARNRKLLGQNSEICLVKTWQECNPGQLSPGSPILAVFSYFFASHSLSFSSIRSLATWIGQVRHSSRQPICLIVYLNSTNELANRNYEIFKNLLGVAPEAALPITSTVEYRKKRGGATSQETFLHEVICLPGGQS